MDWDSPTTKKHIVEAEEVARKNERRETYSHKLDLLVSRQSKEN
jgi:hypothetical protein